jgi:hopanoid biosynthesis associated RND transporter like protein HpnN
VALALVSLVYAWGHLRFDPDREILLSPRDVFRRALGRYQQDFPLQEDLVVVVRGGSAQERERAVDELARQTALEPAVFAHPLSRVELGTLRRAALYYLTLDRLQSLEQQMAHTGPLLEQVARSPGLPELLQGVSGGQIWTGPGRASALRLFNHMLEQLQGCLENRGRSPYHYQPLWQALLPGLKLSVGLPGGELRVDSLADLPTSRYITLGGGRLHVFLVKPAPSPGGKLAAAEVAVGRLREILSRAEERHPLLSFHLTGDPVLQVDEARAVRADTVLSAGLTLAAVSLLFVFSFGEVRRPLLATLALLCGLAWTLGAAALLVGRINLITSTCAAMLIGLGIDFGVLLIYRYDEERGRGRPPYEALRITMGRTGMENFTAALATAGTFATMVFCGMQGAAELGLVASAGILLAFTANATVLPALLLLSDHKGGALRHRRYESSLPARAEGAWLAHPWPVLGACVALTLAALSLLGRVGFNYNVLDIHDPRLDSVQTARELIRSPNESHLFAFSLAADRREAEERAQRFRRLPEVHHVDSVALLLPPDVPAKRESVHRLREAVLHLPDPSPRPLHGARRLVQTARAYDHLRQAFLAAWPGLTGDADPEVRRQAARTRELLARVEKTLRQMGPGAAEQSLSLFQDQVYADVAEVLHFLRQQTEHPPQGLEGLPEEVRVRSQGRSGAILLRIYPRDKVWEAGPLERFVRSLQTVDPEVVGPPVIMYYYTSELIRAFRLSAWWAALTVGLIVALLMGSVRATVLALAPTAVALAWMVGAMGLMGLQFNLVNFISLPLFLGLAPAFGLHVIYRYQEREGRNLFALSTGMAVTVSALTALIGFASMIPGRHWGVASLGLILTVGVGANLLTSVVLLPALLSLVGWEAILPRQVRRRLGRRAGPDQEPGA